MSARELMEARAVGLSAAYVTAMRSAGVEGDLDDFVQLRAVGVSPGLATRARASGMRHLDADTLVEMRVIGPAHATAPHTSRIYVKINRKADPQSDAGNRDANPDPDQAWDPDG